MKAYLSEYDGGSIELEQALLIYKSESHYSGDEQYLVTLNKFNPATRELKAGRPLNRQRLAELLTMLSNRENGKLTLMPDNLLALSAGAMIWWKPEHRDQIFFKTTDKKAAALNGKEVTYPALVFKVDSQGMFVFALASSTRPVADTLLLRAPFWNTWDNGRICLPGGKQYKFLPAGIGFNERLFFDSSFSHSSGDMQITFPGGHNALWKLMTASISTATFPTQYLTASKLTLKDLCK
jgi:PRTRC genetic system protein B